jgi:hypothetical protein
MTEHHYHESEFERYSEEIVGILENWHRNKGSDAPMPGWLFNRKTKKFPPKVLAAVQQSLLLQARLLIESKDNGTVYSLLSEQSQSQSK